MRPFPAALPAVVVLSLCMLQSTPGEDRPMSELSIASPAFPGNGLIPRQYTCDGGDRSPPLSIDGVPEKARSLALVVDDPDAPGGTWVHWVVWNIPADTREIPEGSVPPGALQGTNDFGTRKYGGPCPPSGTHRYFFKLYALDAPLTIPPGATKAQVETAMGGHLLGKAETIGRYRRN